MRLLIFIFILLCANASFAQRKGTYAPKKETAELSEIDTTWAREFGPWDFSGLLGFYNPGLGVQGLAAYRFLNNVLPNVDDSLSAESGLGIVSVTERIAGTDHSYTSFEIPFMARWDFRIPDTDLMLGARGGLNYLSGTSVTSTDGVNRNTRGGSLYFQVGGVGFYRIQEQLWIRAGFAFGGYTTLNVGMTYAL